jgi:uncharacterized protein YdaU (DUF1376 family)
VHQYPHHIGDFRGGTYNMTRLQRAVYRELIDVYYDKEMPLPLDHGDVCREVGAIDQAEIEIVDWLLRFKFTKTDRGYVHDVCERVIDEYRAKAGTARENGKKGGRPKKQEENPKEPSRFFGEPTGNPDETGSQTNRKPLTVNRKPKKIDVSGDAKAVAPNAKIALGDDGAWIGIPDALMATWKQAYPALSLDAELSKAAAWIIANPTNKKSNYARFLTNWMTRSQDRAPRSNTPSQSRQERFDPVGYVNRNRPTDRNERSDNIIDV